MSFEVAGLSFTDVCLSFKVPLVYFAVCCNSLGSGDLSFAGVCISLMVVVVSFRVAGISFTVTDVSFLRINSRPPLTKSRPLCDVDYSD